MEQELLKSLSKIVIQGYHYPAAKGKIQLKEDHSDATCRLVEIEEAEDVLVFKFDRKVKGADKKDLHEPFPFLTPDPPARSKCDYLIFYARKNRSGVPKLYALICNMKSGTKGNLSDQMKSGKILAEMLIKTGIRCQDHWKSEVAGYVPLSEKEIKDIVEYRFIAFVNDPAKFKKGNSKVKPSLGTNFLACNTAHPISRLLS